MHFRRIANSRQAASLLLSGLENHVASLPAAGRHVVAYSGGVDSSVVAAVVHRVHKSSAEALLGVSASLPREQRELALRVAEHIGITLRQIETKEGTEAKYLENTGQACYACKRSLYDGMTEVYLSAAAADFSVRLYNGTNADDVKDATRVGLVAAREFEVSSPLLAVGLTKEQVRIVAKELGLPNALHAASPCLRSRLALGVRATVSALQNIEAAERLVRARLDPALLASGGFNPDTINLRVRHLNDGTARVELDADLLRRRELQDPTWQSGLCEAVVSLGYNGVSIAPFKSGSNSLPNKTD